MSLDENRPRVEGGVADRNPMERLALIATWANVPKNATEDHLRGALIMILQEATAWLPQHLNMVHWRRAVKIRCPKCEVEQEAEESFYQSDPFPSYVHECVECKYMIGESEWDYAVGGGGMPPISSIPKPEC